jgi:hypothetical protein
MKTFSLLVALGLALPAAGWAACGSWTGANPGLVTVTAEAESGAEGGAMSERTGSMDGSSASQGNKYIRSDNDNDGSETISFVAPATGDYKMEALTYAPTGSRNSFYVKLNVSDACGSGQEIWRVNQNSAATWGYVCTDSSGGANDGVADSATNARVWALTAGTTYTITIYCREAYTYMDAIRLRLDPADAAAGTPTRTPTVTATPTRTTAGLSTPTRTPTITPTATPLPPVHQGLPPAQRLYGLEYIPFPVNNNGANSFYDLAVSFTTASANAIPRNTARWRIELVALSATVGSDTIQVETRLGPQGVSCTTGYYEPGNYDVASTLDLPARPQNCSTTYFWLSSAAVPYTEAFDAVGDPRFVPYLDVMSSPAGMPFAGNYNWFFRDLGTDASGAEYRNFATLADFDSTYAGSNTDGEACNVDAPKLMRLWREGVVKTRSVYNSIAGWSNYYIGTGGEIGGDTNNKTTNGVPMYGGPWGSGSTVNVDEIIGSHNSSNENMVHIVKSAGWTSLPWIGELWPDSAYVSDWKVALGCASCTAGGNLRNTQQGGSFFREALPNLALNYNGASFPFANIRKRMNGYGAASFMNNTDSPAFNHNGTSFNAALLPDGAQLGVDYNYTIPDPFGVNRQWGFDLSGTLVAPERSLAPYNTAPVRMTTELYPAGRGFYASNGAANTDRASGPVRGIVNGEAGFFVVNGLAPATESGMSFVAAFALLSCLRTFHDAGAPTVNATGGPWATGIANNVVSGNVYRIEQVPYVQIYYPAKGQPLDGYQSVTLKWTERFVRWDRMPYTENYPCVDETTPNCSPADATKPGNPLKEWHALSGNQLAFNIKYSMDGGGTWTSALTGDPVSVGVYYDGLNALVGNNTHDYSYNWDVSSLAAGTKKLRVECYRPSYPQHYAFHEATFETKP